AVRRARVPRVRIREARGELRGLERTNARGGLAEVSARRRLHAVDAGAELDDVEVELQDSSLGQRALKLPGEDELTQLPERAPGRRQPQVLRELLRDGRGPTRQRLPLDGSLERVPDLAEIHSPMPEEVDVLADDHGALQRQRDGAIGHPGPLHSIVTPGGSLRRSIALDERRRAGWTRG